jgi:hypothetical protein
VQRGGAGILHRNIQRRAGSLRDTTEMEAARMSVTAGAGVRPVPFNGVDSVGGEALLVIVTAAARLPGAEGVKETRTEHELPGCKTVGTWQVSVSAKSWGFAPVIVSVFKFSA